MQQIVEFSKTLTGMPPAALITLVILGAFALAAFAIASMAKVTKGRRNGN